jgi:hypothetical protein
MNCYRTCRTYRLVTTSLLSLALLSLPCRARPECTELKIVEYEDRVEAVCIGEPLTEAQIRANLEEQKRLDREAQQKRVEEQNRQDREAQQKKVEEQNRQRDEARAAKAKAEADLEMDRKRRNLPPATPRQIIDSTINSPRKF